MLLYYWNIFPWNKLLLTHLPLPFLFPSEKGKGVGRNLPFPSPHSLLCFLYLWSPFSYLSIIQPPSPPSLFPINTSLLSLSNDILYAPSPPPYFRRALSFHGTDREVCVCVCVCVYAQSTVRLFGRLHNYFIKAHHQKMSFK